jgi:hypothetical protein
MASGIWTPPLTGVKLLLGEALDRAFPPSGKRGRRRGPSLQSVICGYYLRFLRAQGLTTAEAGRFLLPIANGSDPKRMRTACQGCPARAHFMDRGKRIEPFSKSALDHYERAIQELEQAAGAPISSPRNSAETLAAYHHAEAARREAKAHHDAMLRRLDFGEAWNDRDFLRVRTEFDRHSAEALRAQLACTALPGHPDLLHLEIEALQADSERTEARLNELACADQKTRKQRARNQTDVMTTADVALLNHRDYEQLLHDLYPEWQDNPTPSSDVYSRQPLPYCDDLDAGTA